MRKSFGKRLSVVFERQNEKQTVHPPSDTFAGPKENITKGTTNTTFSPDANCTRAQIVTFIWRALAEYHSIL